MKTEGVNKWWFVCRRLWCWISNYTNFTQWSLMTWRVCLPWGTDKQVQHQIKLAFFLGSSASEKCCVQRPRLLTRLDSININLWLTGIQCLTKTKAKGNLFYCSHNVLNFKNIIPVNSQYVFSMWLKKPNWIIQNSESPKYFRKALLKRPQWCYTLCSRLQNSNIFVT